MASVNGWAIFQFHDLRYYCLSRFSNVLASAAQNVAVGWFVYDLTRSAWSLGLAGLFTFLPMLVLSPITGQVADQFDRRVIVAICSCLTTLVSLLLLIYSLSGYSAVEPIYVLVTCLGSARAFSNPASKALQPNLVPREHFGTAVAWSSSFEQFANTTGPAMGGLLYMLGADVVFGVAALLNALSAISIFKIKARPEPLKREPVTWLTISAGLRYIYAQKVLFGAISLDMVAVCMGGVTALLPIFSDALGAGAWGTGFLRSAQAIGAFCMAYVLTQMPVKYKAGPKMLWSVAAYGASILTFGLSDNIYLSVFALFCVGASDQISVFIRHTIVQTDTPDHMRGRVSAVNVIFVGASGSLGEFESGALASLIGVIPAVVVGGSAAIVCAGLWALMFKSLRERDALIPPELASGQK
ncbi:MAG: MFS transporter [Alphaproteobacteria bacterium]|nr:MFS transporter [Alphaproteobacteria bacterium]